MIWWLLACSPSGEPTAEVPSGRSARGDVPAEGVPAESDRAGSSGVIGVEKLDDDGDRKVFVRRLGRQLTTELVVSENLEGVWTEEVRLYGSTMPDRPAISPEGDTIAFTSGISGLASVWVMPFGGGADPIQVTNVGLHLKKRAPGEPPLGFVPPPVDDSLTFVGDELQWTGPDGAHTVRWR